MVINVPHIDGKIWNPAQIATDIAAELFHKGNVDIRIDNEGSDLDFLGLNSMLESICQQFDFKPEQITIHTCNQIQDKSKYNIVKYPPLYVDSGQKFVKENQIADKQFDKIKHFGIFISRSSWQRLWMSAWLDSNYHDKTLMTYHYNESINYHRPHLGFDNLTVEIGTKQASSLCADFLKKLPIIQEEIDSYPILTPAHFNISKIYHRFFVEIVCETFLQGKTFYPTEKTWRPFITMTPFMTVGPRDHLANLKRLGFKTFDQWWDESYDEDADLDNGRWSIITIQNNCNKLSRMTQQQLKSMYEEMLPTLEHNRQRFLNLSSQDFNKLWP